MVNMSLKLNILILFISFGSAISQKKSVVFVVDVTNSMNTEVDQLKKVCSGILETFHNKTDSSIANYVLSMFQDPHLYNVTNTTDPHDINVELETVPVKGGGKCPENAISGIRQALPYALPNSIVFVFTDATCHDHNLTDEVLNVLREKQMTVSFLITPTVSKLCVDETLDGPGYEAYKRIVGETKGLILHMEKLDVAHVVSNLTFQFHPNHAVTDVIEKPAGEFVEPMKIDSSMEEVKIISDSDHLSAVSPHNKIHNSTKVGSSNVLQLLKPEPGDWKININSANPSTAQVAAISNVKYDYGFSLTPTDKKEETKYQPIKGSLGYVTVFVSNPEEIKELSKIEITKDISDNYEFPLKKIENGVYRTELIKTPLDSFDMHFYGFDKSGNAIYRLLNRLILPEVKNLEDSQVNELEKVLDEMKFTKGLKTKFIENNVSVQMMKNGLIEEFYNELSMNVSNGLYYSYKRKLANFVRA